MPRIYYRERKLHTPPLKNEVITPTLFNEIIGKSDFIAEDALQIFELPPVATLPMSMVTFSYLRQSYSSM